MPDATLTVDGSSLMNRLRKISAVLYALVLLASSWTYVVWLLEQDHRTALESSQRRLGQFAKGLGLQVEAMASDGLGAASVGAALMGSGVTGSDATAQLSAALTGGKYVRALFVVDGSALVMAQRPEEDLGASTSSLQPALHGARAPVWSGPMVDTPSGKAFPVARRTVIRDREVWVGAWLGTHELEEIYADFKQPHAYVALTTLDGMILGRFPPDSSARSNSDSKSAMHARFSNMPVHSTALVAGPDPASGQIFQYGAYRVAGLPLLALAGRARDDALASWRARRDKTVLYTVITTMVVFGFAVML